MIDILIVTLIFVQIIPFFRKNIRILQNYYLSLFINFVTFIISLLLFNAGSSIASETYKVLSITKIGFFLYADTSKVSLLLLTSLFFIRLVIDLLNLNQKKSFGMDGHRLSLSIFYLSLILLSADAISLMTSFVAMFAFRSLNNPLMSEEQESKIGVFLILTLFLGVVLQNGLVSNASLTQVSLLKEVFIVLPLVILFIDSIISSHSLTREADPDKSFPNDYIDIVVLSLVISLKFRNQILDSEACRTIFSFISVGGLVFSSMKILSGKTREIVYEALRVFHIAVILLALSFGFFDLSVIIAINGLLFSLLVYSRSNLLILNSKNRLVGWISWLLLSSFVALPLSSSFLVVEGLIWQAFTLGWAIKTILTLLIILLSISVTHYFFKDIVINEAKKTTEAIPEFYIFLCFYIIFSLSLNFLLLPEIFTGDKNLLASRLLDLTVPSNLQLSSITRNIHFIFAILLNVITVVIGASIASLKLPQTKLTIVASKGRIKLESAISGIIRLYKMPQMLIARAIPLASRTSENIVNKGHGATQFIFGGILSFIKEFSGERFERAIFLILVGVTAISIFIFNNLKQI